MPNSPRSPSAHQSEMSNSLRSPSMDAAFGEDAHPSPAAMAQGSDSSQNGSNAFADQLILELRKAYLIYSEMSNSPRSVSSHENEMLNSPRSPSMDAAFGEDAPPSLGATAEGSDTSQNGRNALVDQLVLELIINDLREEAMRELLSLKRELFQDLAPLLWNSFGTIAALLQEIVSIYPVLSPPNLTPVQSNRVCNALALLQCVASHPDTRMLFLNAHIPLYLYPFLNTQSKSRPFEYLRLTSLGVIGALVKVDDTEVISFLLSTEIIPLCLRTMERGSELSKTVATFIVQKILLDDVGLDYICTTAERFFAVGRVLGNMVAALAEQPSSRLLKHIIRCYLRLSDNTRACDALRSCLPDMLRDATFSSCLREDPTTRKWLQQLLHNVGVNRVPSLQAGGGGFEHLLVN